MGNFIVGTNSLISDDEGAGETALHDACRFGHYKVAGLLLAAGADPRIANKEGKDALAITLDYGSVKFGVEKKWFEQIAAQIRHQLKKPAGGRSKL